MEFAFIGPIWEWRGPAPYHFVSVPDDDVDLIRAEAQALTYGWGMIPVEVRIGTTRWTTSLWPKDGGYVLPVKDAVRRAERLDLGDVAEVAMTLSRRD